MEEGEEEDTFCMSVMSTREITLFFLEEPDLELELSKHR